MVLTIHQPNFVPWLPFFRKMAAADKMVIMQECQFEKGGFQNRFKFNGQWYTMSAGPKSLVPIHQKAFLKPEADWAAIKGRLPQFKHVLRDWDHLIEHDLVRTNVSIIRDIAERLGITTPMEFDQPTDKRATARLVEICQQHGADVYLSGPSGSRYLDHSQFTAAGIQVKFYGTSENRHSLEVL